jgi:hypothetical protein
MSAEAPVAERTAKHNECKAIFDEAFERTAKSIEFNPNWSNGSGLFDFAVYGEHAPAVPAGSMYKAQTVGGRRMLIIGTKLGNVIVFERHIDHPKANTPVFCYQSTSIVAQGGWFSDSLTLDEYELALAVGTDKEPHLGRRIDILHSALKKAA